MRAALLASLTSKMLVPIIGALALLFGCATKSYDPPQSGPVAHVRFVTTFDGINLPIRRFRSADCADYPGELVGLLNSKTSGEQSNTELPSTVPANEPFRFSILAVTDIAPALLRRTKSRVRVCQPVIEFTPRDGARYEVVHGANNAGCVLQVFQLVGTPPYRIADATAKISAQCQAHRYP